MRKVALLFSMLLLMLCCDSQSGLEKRPNVVLIVVDALRPDHLPFYGYNKNTAPFLSDLAKKGVVFEHVFSTSSWTAPSVASIFTGLYPFQHGVTTVITAQKKLIKIDPTIEVTRLPGPIETLPEFLKKEGYQTFGVSSNVNIEEAMGFNQGFDRLIGRSHQKASVANRMSLEILNQRDINRPYFLYLHYDDTHAPYRLKLSEEQRSGNLRQDRKAKYDLEIALVDKKIRELFETLGWNENTLLVMTADHGEEFYEHGKTGHGYSLFLEAIRVPLIIYFPQRVPAGKRVAANVSHIDIFPSIVDVIDAKATNRPEGRTLLPLLNGHHDDDKERCLFAHLSFLRAGSKKVVILSAVCGKYHYIVRLPDKEMLFDISTDPLEANNLIEREGTRAKQMARQYFDFLQNCIKYSEEKAFITLDKKQIEQLKALGYIR